MKIERIVGLAVGLALYLAAYWLAAEAATPKGRVAEQHAVVAP